MAISQIQQASLASGVPSSIASSALPSGSIVQCVTFTDTTQYAAAPGAFNLVQLGGTFGTFTMTNTANKLLVMTSVRGGAQSNQGLIQVQYSNNGGSSWTALPGRTNTNGTNNQITHGQAYGTGDQFTHEMHTSQILLNPASSSTWQFRVMGMVDSSGNMFYGRVAQNAGIGTDDYSYITCMEIKV